MLAGRGKLIPRYNWDFQIQDLGRALASALRSAPPNPRAFQTVFGIPAVFTGSGRTSLHLILKALALPEGAGVGVPLFCCPVVFEAVRSAGCRPVFIDIDSRNFCLSARDLERKLPSLSALVAVHMFGLPADLHAIKAVAGPLPIIEDCAQSLYSTYKGTLTGLGAPVSFFSFRTGKYLSAGAGGAILCRDEDLRARIEAMASRLERPSLVGEVRHCAATWIKSALYRRPFYGIVSRPLGKRLDQRLNLTAKSGVVPHGIARSDFGTICRRIGTFRPKIEQQRRNALFLLERIDLQGAVLPFESPGCRSTYYQFPLRLKSQRDRDQLVAFLESRGIDAPKYLDGIAGEAARSFGYAGDCPVAEACSQTVAVIPSYYTLSDRDLDHIAAAINQWGAGRSAVAYGRSNEDAP